MIFQRVLVFLVAIYHARSYTLPSYVHICSISDPKIGDCIKAEMIKLLPRFVKGNAALHVPPLNPFHLTEIVIEATQSLTLKLSEVDIYGIELAQVVDIVSDMQKRTSSIDLRFPLLNVRGTYDVDGQIMFLPIKGHGPLNITATNADFHFEISWGVEKKNGVEYATLNDGKLTYKTEKTHFQFDNLFNGNKELGDQVNTFINENAKDLSKDVSPAVSDTIKTVIMAIFRSVAAQVPYAQLFKP